VQIDQHHTPPSGHPGDRIHPQLLDWRVASEALRPTLRQPVRQTFATLAVEEISEDDRRHRDPSPRRDNVFENLGRAPVEFPPDAHRTISPLLVDRAALLFNAAIDYGTSTQIVEAREFFLDVWICIVQVRRPWFSDALLSLPNWYVVGLAKGAFSSAPPEHVGNLSILPTACIFVRDIKIKAQW